MPRPTDGFALTCCISGKYAAAIALLLTSACARRYAVEGVVLRVLPERHTVVVSHKEIPRYMNAMAMPFTVRKAEELARVRPGSRVQFELVVGRKDSFARNLKVRAGDEALPIPESTERVAIGAPVPDFNLTDHLGQRISLAGLRGKVAAINFIYTRCPLPEVCPRLAANFARVQRRFASRMGSDLVLLSVTLDPQHDTGDVWARYAETWSRGDPEWHFLTGRLDEVRRAAGLFGLVFWAEEGLITHTSQTGLIARDGRLAAIIEGSDYSADQLGDLIDTVLEGP